ncbi:MAG TPA: hypothetical protein VEL07_01945 [Planctomycetota bacterium]|nr:hypothetical protein [Planctomycetota bacterium]
MSTVRLFAGAFLMALAGLAAVAAEERMVTLCDFESYDGGKYPPDGAGEVTTSTDWKVDGASSLRIDPGMSAVVERMARKDWSGFTTLRFHFRNPTAQTISVGFELADQPAKGYWDRHQNAFGVEAGEHVVDVDLSGGLWRSELNRPYRGDVKTPMELTQITRFMLNNSGQGPLFVDAVQLVSVPRLTCDGGFAFDFGRSESQVMGQYTGVNETTAYDASRGYGLTGGAQSLKWDMAYPTTLLGDSLHWQRGFRVDLPKGGTYLGIVAFERGGFWGGNEATAYASLTLSANDTVVHRDESSRDATHFAFQDVEIVDPQRIVDDLILPAAGWKRFAFDAATGGNTFTVAVQDMVGFPIRVAGLILAPDTAEGRAFLDAHEQLQRQATLTMFTPQDRGRRGEGRAKPAKDLVCVPMAVGDEVYPRDWPASGRGAASEVVAVRGQIAAIQLGVYATRDLKVTVEAKASGPGTLPEPIVSYGRYMPQRPYGTGAIWLQINHFRPEPTFTVGADLSRAVVVEFAVPADAKPGDYACDIVVAGGGTSAKVPVKLRIAAAELAPIPIPVGMFANALSFGPDIVDEATWWRLQEGLLREQTAAGLTLVTGGDGLPLHVAADGTVSGDAAIRYLKLAKSLGALAAVNYGGFLPHVSELRDNAAAVAKGIAALEASGVLPQYINSFDEPVTPPEIQGAIAAIGDATAAGLRTVGWTSAHWDDPEWLRLMKASHAAAFNGHDASMFARMRELGREPWAYNNASDRYAFGIHLWRQIKLGCAGRAEWIGLYVQGYAFHNLDGREPADAMFAVHKRFGVLRTTNWLRARQGLTDARLLLALEKRAPKDPIFARIGLDGYHTDRAAWPEVELDRLRADVLARLGELAGAAR